MLQRGALNSSHLEPTPGSPKRLLSTFRNGSKSQKFRLLLGLKVRVLSVRATRKSHKAPNSQQEFGRVTALAQKYSQTQHVETRDHKILERFGLEGPEIPPKSNPRVLQPNLGHFQGWSSSGNSLSGSHLWEMELIFLIIWFPGKNEGKEKGSLCRGWVPAALGSIILIIFYFFQQIKSCSTPLLSP